MKFTKMHGIGNDYVYVNCFEESIKNPAWNRQRLCICGLYEKGTERSGRDLKDRQ